MYTCAYKGHVAYKGRVVTNQVHLMIACCQHPLLTFAMGKSNKIYINIYLYNSFFFLFILYIHILLYFPYVSKKKNTKKKKNWKKKIKNIKANSTWCSQAVTHPSTNQAQRCLTSLIGREAVHSTWYGRWQWDRFLNPIYMLHLGLFSNFQICIGKSC